MLRVITEQQGASYRLLLHGMPGGEWVPLLEQQWRTIAQEVPSARVTIVLSMSTSSIRTVSDYFGTWPLPASSS